MGFINLTALSPVVVASKVTCLKIKFAILPMDKAAAPDDLKTTLSGCPAAEVMVWNRRYRKEADNLKNLNRHKFH